MCVSFAHENPTKVYHTIPHMLRRSNPKRISNINAALRLSQPITGEHVIAYSPTLAQKRQMT